MAMPDKFLLSRNTVAMAAPPHRPQSLSSLPSRDMNSTLDSEVWHACAGPLVCLPRLGDRVVYFPQGHIEQVAASTNQSADVQMPHYNLPPQIFCRLLNLTLGADRETDEVFAQMTLVPETEQAEQALTEEPEQAPCHRRKLAMFCKNLTSSDTSTHGGFSVPRRAAEECLPALDYQQSPPAQELVAKDLHGVEWKFRHIYRGQPRRHLLTTGWSVFVSQKKLVAGDAVLFLRGENGELRIGVRRAVRQQNSVTSSSLLSSHSMHLGVLAAAAHAVSTKTMFTIFYNPRASPAEFVVSYQKYAKAFTQSLSVGMRFKMRFETEDSSERRYIGTITGIGDCDPERWPNSKWRCLQAGWDEQTANDRQDKVSPWEIEPSVAPTAVTSPPQRVKKLKPNSQSADHSVMGVRQATEQIRRLSKDEDDAPAATSFLPWHDPRRNAGQLHMSEAPGMDVFSGHMLPGSFAVVNNGSLQQFREPLNPSMPTFSSYSPCMEADIQLSVAPRPNVGVPQHHWLAPMGTDPTTADACKAEVAEHCLHQHQHQHVANPRDEDAMQQSYKIFGFSLLDKTPSIPAAAATCTHNGSCEEEQQPRVAANSNMIKDRGVARAAPEPASARIPARTCTKVHLQGAAVGRAVDLSKFSSYAELFHELQQLFGLDKALEEAESGWQVVYTDNEGDMLLVGDDPWPEFCSIVRNIRILSPVEVEKLTQGGIGKGSVEDDPSLREASKLSDHQDSSSPNHL